MKENTQTNKTRETQDGLTEEQINTAYEVLETLRESLANSELNDEADVVNNAHYLLQQYDEGASWHTVQEEV